jgi:hypothetical protein
MLTEALSLRDPAALGRQQSKFGLLLGPIASVLQNHFFGSHKTAVLTSGISLSRR